MEVTDSAKDKLNTYAKAHAEKTWRLNNKRAGTNLLQVYSEEKATSKQLKLEQMGILVNLMICPRLLFTFGTSREGPYLRNLNPNPNSY